MKPGVAYVMVVAAAIAPSTHRIGTHARPAAGPPRNRRAWAIAYNAAARR